MSHLLLKFSRKKRKLRFRSFTEKRKPEKTRILAYFNPLLHNVENGQTYLKILRCEHRKIFKVCLAIFQHYAIKG